MTDSAWLHYRDLKSRCPVCKRPAHIAKRDGNFYFVDDEFTQDGAKTYLQRLKSVWTKSPFWEAFLSQ